MQSAVLGSSPKAVRTRFSRCLEEHAEPAETYICFAERYLSITSLLMPGSESETTCGIQFSGEFIFTDGIISLILSKRSFFNDSTLFIFSVLKDSLQAVAKAAMLGSGSVPGLISFSCPPPRIIPFMRRPERIKSPPTPLGACILWPLTEIRSAPQENSFS